MPFTLYVSTQSSNARVQFQNASGGDVTIDNVSLREVGQNWNLENTWTIGNSVANGNGAVGSTEELTQNNTFTLGKTYKVVYDVLNYVSGNIRFQFSGGATLSGTTRSSDGTFTEYVVATANHTLLKFKAGSAFNGSITNISVKEVGQNWSVVNAAITDVGNLNGTGVTSMLFQDVLTNGSTYKATFTISNYNSIGNSDIINSGGTPIYVINSNGTFTITFTHTNASGNIFWRARNSAIFSINDVTIIQISSDTNLPRINYEGFSYQDALGSEEVVNGNFATDLSGWSSITNVTWSSNFGGSAFMNANGTNAQFRQFITYVVGKTYRISWEVKENNGCDLFRVYNNGGFTNITDNFVGTHTIDFTQTSGTLFLLRNDTIGSNITIDNVSVKEVTGQEVVPDSGCGSWLWEPQSTNLITQSELFSDASWVKTNTTISSNSVTSPNGTIDADYLQENSSNATHIIRQDFSLSATSYTLSIFAKQGAGSERQIGLLFNSNSSGALFNLTDGSVISTIGTPITKAQEMGNGWYRFSITTTSTAITENCRIYLGNNGIWTSAYQGDGTSGVYIWGAMLEQNSFSTSYIPTSGSTVTRNQDLCTNGGSLASINSTEGTLYFEGSALSEVSTIARRLSISDGSNSNRLYFYYIGSGGFAFASFVGGVLQANITFGDTITNNSKVACKYKENDYALWVDGVEVGTDTSSSVWSSGTLNTLSFSDANSTSPFFGKTKALAVWKEALSDAELTALTTI